MRLHRRGEALEGAVVVDVSDIGVVLVQCEPVEDFGHKRWCWVGFVDNDYVLCAAGLVTLYWSSERGVDGQKNDGEYDFVHREVVGVVECRVAVQVVSCGRRRDLINRSDGENAENYD